MISAVVPVYNEASVLESSLRRIHGFLQEHFPSEDSKGGFEIVCVNDGSTDSSREILANLEEELGLTILDNPQNQGKGLTVCRGMLAAKGDRVFFTDADLSTPLEELLRFLPHFEEGAEVVTGNRKNSQARIEVPQPIHRVYLGLGFTRLVNLMMGLSVSDYTCGFKCFTHQAAQDIFSRCRISGWTFDVEILFLAQRLGYRHVEIPVTWADNPNSKVRVVRAILGSFAELFKIRRDVARGEYGTLRRTEASATSGKGPRAEASPES